MIGLVPSGGSYTVPVALALLSFPAPLSLSVSWHFTCLQVE